MNKPELRTELSSVGNYIDNQIVAGKGSRAQDIFNPATGKVSGSVTLSTAADVDAAVKSAKAAFPAWADTPPIRRARVMNKYLSLLNQHKDELARAIAQRIGDAERGGMRRDPRLVR